MTTDDVVDDGGVEPDFPLAMPCHAKRNILLLLLHALKMKHMYTKIGGVYIVQESWKARWLFLLFENTCVCRYNKEMGEKL